MNRCRHRLSLSSEIMANNVQRMAEHPLQTLCRVRGLRPKQVISTMMELPYPADPIIEPDFVGMTYGEVALFRQVQRAASGSRDALEMILDRTEGKPIQTNQNVNTSMTYQDFLLKIAAEEGEIIDVEPEPRRPSEEIS